MYRPDNGTILNGGVFSSVVTDLLSGATATKGIELKNNIPLNQNWVWVKEDQWTDFPIYIGFLKSLYVLVQIGHLQYLEPESGTNFNYNVSFDENDPPT